MFLVPVALIIAAIVVAVILVRRRGGRIHVLPVLGWSGVGVLAAIGIAVGFFGGAWGLVPGVPAIGLFVIMALITVRGRPDAGWFLPFAWILVVPAVTVPLQIGLLGLITDGYEYAGAYAEGDAGACAQVRQEQYDKMWDCPAGAALPTLLPGLLNVAPAIGLFSASRRVRYAALVAGGLGAVRLLVPALIYGADALESGVEIIGSWQWPPAMGSEASGLTSVALWVLSLGVALVFAVRAPSPEAGAWSPGRAS